MPTYGKSSDEPSHMKQDGSVAQNTHNVGDRISWTLRPKVSAKLNILDGALQAGPYFLGETPTIADFFLLPAIDYLATTPEGPELTHWQLLAEQIGAKSDVDPDERVHRPQPPAGRRAVASAER